MSIIQRKDKNYTVKPEDIKDPQYSDAYYKLLAFIDGSTIEYKTEYHSSIIGCNSWYECSRGNKSVVILYTTVKVMKGSGTFRIRLDESEAEILNNIIEDRYKEEEKERQAILLEARRKANMESEREALAILTIDEVDEELNG